MEITEGPTSQTAHEIKPCRNSALRPPEDTYQGFLIHVYVNDIFDNKKKSVAMFNVYEWTF